MTFAPQLEPLLLLTCKVLFPLVSRAHDSSHAGPFATASDWAKFDTLGALSASSTEGTET
jgi:hypothetical protein